MRQISKPSLESCELSYQQFRYTNFSFGTIQLLELSSRPELEDHKNPRLLGPQRAGRKLKGWTNTDILSDDDVAYGLQQRGRKMNVNWQRSPGFTSYERQCRRDPALCKLSREGWPVSRLACKTTYRPITTHCKIVHRSTLLHSRNDGASREIATGIPLTKQE
jgi:hypothetical protein